MSADAFSGQVVSAESLRAAQEVFDLSLTLGMDRGSAIVSALASGIRMHEQLVLDRLAEKADTYSREMQATEPDDEDAHPAFGVALAWFADEIRKEKDIDPTEGTYNPSDRDVVAVTIVGEVEIVRDTCTHCGQEASRSSAWRVTDDYTGVEVVFPGGAKQGVKPHVRVLSRAREQSQVLPENEED